MNEHLDHATAMDRIADHMDTAGLLRSAANLVQQALSRLDSEAAPCTACGRREFRNKLHAKILEEINATPNKLNSAANRLLGLSS